MDKPVLPKKDTQLAKLNKKYFSPVPTPMRKVGDMILYTSLSLQPMVMTLPLDDSHKLWWNFGISAAGVIGKVITNFSSVK